MMDRRTFNKALGGLFAGALIPISEPIAATVSSLTPHTPSHFGLTHFGITSSFELPTTFGLGQIEVFQDIAEEPKIEGEFAFYTNEERTEEATVFFEGTHKEWSVDAKLAESVPDSILGKVVDDSHLSGQGRMFYEMKSVEVFYPNGGDQVNLLDIQRHRKERVNDRDQCYDIVLRVSSDSQETYTVTMKNALIVDLVIASDNENNFQS